MFNLSQVDNNSLNSFSLKKPSEIEEPQVVMPDWIRPGARGKAWGHLKIFRYLKRITHESYSAGFRKFTIILLFLSFAVAAFAPGNNSVFIPVPLKINPYRPLIYATAMVETLGNPLAYNEHENAVGIFQIRQVRVDEYNRRTGSKYTLPDMFNYSISEEVFLYFASRVGPYDFERISKSWNGSGPKTENYWKKIKVYLD